MSRKVQIVFTDADLARLETLRSSSSRRTIADVVRDALALYDWTRRQHAEGFAIAATKGDRSREVVLPFELASRGGGA